MPYNTAAIPPRKEITGQAQLPLTRVKKIIALDSDISQCSNNAAFVVTLATEMFIQYLAEQAHNVVKSERKPRRNIQYRDLANAVARHDVLEFLTDIVPRTMTFKEAMARGIGDTSKKPVEPGQTTLDGKGQSENGASNGFVADGSVDDALDDEAGQAGPSAQLQMEIRGMQKSTGSVEEANGNGKGGEDEDMDIS